MKTVSVSPHIHTNNSIQKSMLLVSAALLPAAAWGVYSFGLRALLVLLVSIISCVLTEFLLGLINKEKTISDGSALVTGLLIGMNMPSTVPFYVPIIASVFAIAVVKWTFGGLGCNWMNPALAGRVFVFFSFTTLMSTFALPHALETNYVLPGREVATIEAPADSVSAATLTTAESNGKGGMVIIANKFIQVDFPEGFTQSDISSWADAVIAKYPTIFNGYTCFFNSNGILEFEAPSKINDLYHVGLISIIRTELANYIDNIAVDSVSAATKVSGTKFRADGFDGSITIANRFITVTYPDKFDQEAMAAWADSVIAKYPDILGGAKHFAGATYYEFELPEKINDNLHDLINSVLSSEVSAFIVENSSVDTVSSATMLSANKTALVGGAKGNMESVLSSVNVPVTQYAADFSAKTGISPYTIDAFLGNQGGCIGEVSALLLIVGGIFLIAAGVITWHIPVVYIGSFAILSFIFGGIPAGNGLFHGEILTPIFTGGLMLGAFFMATDWVTTPTTTLGQVIFAIGCGFFTFLFRYFGSLPEGTSLAIILMNIVTPTIDRYIKPKKFGFVKAAKEKKR